MDQQSKNMRNHKGRVRIVFWKNEKRSCFRFRFSGSQHSSQQVAEHFPCFVQSCVKQLSPTVLGKRNNCALYEKMLLFNKLTKILTLISLIVMSSTCGDLI